MTFTGRLVLAIVILATFGGLIMLLSQGDPDQNGSDRAVRWESSQQCQQCHEQVYAEWFSSHHRIAYTNPEAARKLLRFRYHMLGAARDRAAELSQAGALYPWRTINGEEASAYYAAGTAQYHINAAVVYALERYLNATADVDFLADEGAELLVATARLSEDLGF